MSGESYGNPKVDRALDACVDFTERDFADLAIAAADQAMLDVPGQRALRVLLDTATTTKPRGCSACANPQPLSRPSPSCLCDHCVFMRTELAEARFAKMEALKQAGSAERSLHLATLTATRLEALKDHYEEQLNKTEAERDALKSRVEELQTDLAELQSDYDKHASDYQIEPDSNATLGLVPS